MTPKRVEYDPHAVRRMRLRGFTRQDVRTILAVGVWSPEYARPGAEQRFSKRAYLGRREARVVYLENAERVYVVTVEWVGEPPGEPDA